MNDKKTIGENVDEVISKVSEKFESNKGKIASAKDSVAAIAHDISKTVKKAVNDSGNAVSDLIHKK